MRKKTEIMIYGIKVVACIACIASAMTVVSVCAQSGSGSCTVTLVRPGYPAAKAVDAVAYYSAVPEQVARGLVESYPVVAGRGMKPGWANAFVKALREGGSKASISCSNEK